MIVWSLGEMRSNINWMDQIKDFLSYTPPFPTPGNQDPIPSQQTEPATLPMLLLLLCKFVSKSCFFFGEGREMCNFAKALRGAFLPQDWTNFLSRVCIAKPFLSVFAIIQDKVEFTPAP